MKAINTTLLIGLLFVSSAKLTWSQTTTFQPKGSFTFDMGVPAKPQNEAFANLMAGLFNGGIGYNYNVFKGLTIGGGLKYSFFTLNTFALNNLPISGSYHMPGAYLRLGYEKFTSERVSVAASLRGGYSYMLSVNDSCRANIGGPSIEDAIFLEPQVEIILIAEKSSPHGFSGVLGYAFYFNEFNKTEMCMDQIPNINKESYLGITRFLSIGFGYKYYFGRL